MTFTTITVSKENLIEQEKKMPPSLKGLAEWFRENCFPDGMVLPVEMSDKETKEWRKKYPYLSSIEYLQQVKGVLQ